jgi:hypothetical protein
LTLGVQEEVAVTAVSVNVYGDACMLVIKFGSWGTPSEWRVVPNGRLVT